MPPLVDIDTLSNKIRKKGVPPSDFDVKFICNKGSKRQIIEAHKFLLALGSDVFKAQFYGSLKGEEEIETDWNFKDFKLFISTFYGKVNLRGKSLQRLCGLFHISDYYNVSEIKTTIIKIIKSENCLLTDEEIIEAAFIAQAHDEINSELSRPLYDRILEHCGTTHSGIENLFNKERHRYEAQDFEKMVRSVIREADRKVERCSNCKKKKFNCRIEMYVSPENFVPGAEVTVTEDMNDSRLLVHRLGELRSDMTFTSVDRLGFDLPPLPLNYREYKYTCQDHHLYNCLHLSCYQNDM